MRIEAIVLVLSLTVRAFGLPVDKEDGFELRQLTEDNFQNSIAKGLW